MSKSIDERIVRMQFDNAGFESNISQSMSSLDKFNNQLNGLGPEAQTTGSHFSAFSEIAVGAMRQLGASITNFVEGKLHALIQPIEMIGDKLKGMVENLTVEQVSAGWDKYTSKAESVQTMMGATREYYTEMLGDEYSMEAQLELINEQMEKLNWYTDETSYSYSDMANNIAKFTSNGVALEDATDAMMGIASWGAAAGAKNVEVGRAMYNISQAMASGAMTRIDWKSIENANMATAEFKQMAAQAAVLEGTLVDLGDGMYQTLNGDQWNINTLFQDALKERWLDTDVMMDTFDQYGQFSAQLYDLGQLIEENNIEGFDLVSQQLDLVDAWKDGSLTLSDLTGEMGLNEDQANQLAEALTILSDDQYELGMRAFRAGQEYKTFTDVVEATADAASTHWMNIFEQLFGDLLTAKGLWSQMGETFYEIFVAPLDTVSDALDSWIEKGGRDDFFAGIMNSMEAILNVVKAVGEVLYETFFAGLFDDDAEGLVKLSAAFKDWSEKIKAASEDLDWLKGILHGFIAIIRVPIDFIRSLVGALAGAAQYFGLFGGSVKEAAGNFGEWLADVLPKKENFDAFFLSIGNGLLKAKNAIDEFLKSHFNTSLKDIGGNIKKAFGDIAETLKNIIAGFKENGFTGAFEAIKKAFGFISDSADDVGKVKDGFLDIKETLKIGDAIDFSALSGAGSRLSIIFKALGGVVLGIVKVFEKIKNLFTGVAKDKSAEEIKESFQPLEGVGKILDKFKAAIEHFLGGELTLDTLLATVKKVVGALAIIDLGGILHGIHKFTDGVASIPTGLGKILENTAGVVKKFGGVLESLGGLIDAHKKKVNVGIFKTLAEAVLMLAAAVFIVAMLDWKKALISVGIISILIGELVAVFVILSKQEGSVKGGGATLLALALAVDLLALAVAKIAKIDWKQALLGAGIIAVLVAELAGTLLIMGKSKTSMAGGATTLLALAAAVNILAKAVKKIADMDPNSAWRGFAIVSLLIIELAGTAILLGKSSTNIKDGVKAIKDLAVAIVALAVAVKLLGGMSWGELAKGLGSVAVLIAALTISLKAMPTDTKSAGALLAMAAAVTVLVAAVALFGNMDTGTLTKGLIAVAVGLGELVLAANLMEGTLAGSAAILVMALAITALVPAIVMLGSIDFFVLAQGLLALVAVFAIMGVAGAVIGPLAPALLALSGAIALMSLAMIAAGAGMLLFSTALAALAVSGAAGFAVLTTGILSLAATLPMIAIAAATAFTTFIAIIGLNAPIIAQAFGNIVVAILEQVQRLVPELGATVIVIFETILATIQELIPSVIDVIKTFISELLQMFIDLEPQISELITAVVSIIETFFSELLQMVIDLAPQVGEAVVAICTAALDAVQEIVPQIVETVLTIIDELLASLAEHVPNFVNSGLDMVQGILTGIAEHIGEIVTAFIDIILQTIQAIEEKIPDIIQEGWNLILAIINGIAQGIEDNMEDLHKAMDRLAKAIIDFVKEFLGIRSSGGSESQVFHDDVGVSIIEGIKGGIDAVKETLNTCITTAMNACKSAAQTVASTFHEIGSNIVNGIKNGIEWAGDTLHNIGSWLANKIKGGAEAEAQISSPSKVFYGIGQYMDMGLINGLLAGEKDIFRAGSDISNSAISAVQEAMAHVGDVVEDDMTMSPVIRPVVDLSEIESGSNRMNSLLNNGMYTTGISGIGIGGVSPNAQLLGAINSINSNQSANPYSGINIYVTGGDGANAEEIADEVMRRLDREVQRRKAAFA